MRAILSILVVHLAIVAAPLARAEALKKFDLDDAAGVSPKIEVDTQIKVEGKSSLKITTRGPTTISLAEVDGVDVENAKLIYQAQVKSQLNGTAYLEMWVQIGDGEYFSKGLNDVVSQQTNWKTIQTPFFLQPGQKPKRVILNLVIQGQGTVWIDDIVLTKDKLSQTAAHAR